jgi:glyoxylase-like metal-dependent hydrolase (beta-lactamase superfamily II)
MMKVTERVHVVGSGWLGFGLSHDLDCHVYLINGGTELALIDAGAGVEVERIVANICTDGLDPRNLKYVLLTHAHSDHAGGCKFWKDRCGARVFGSPETAKFVSAGDEDGISLTLAKAGGFYPADYRFPACSVDGELREGDIFRVGDCQLRAIETSGHCCGMLSFLTTVEGRTHLFSGDTIFHGGKILMTNVYDCDFQQYVKSVQKLGMLSVDTLLPGHLGIVVGGGQSHIQKALDCLARMVLPPNII